MEKLSEDSLLLIISDNKSCENLIPRHLKNAVFNSIVETLTRKDSNVYDAVVVSFQNISENTEEIFKKALVLLKQGGILSIKDVPQKTDKIEFDLKVNGYVDISFSNCEVIAYKPKYDLGSSQKINLSKKTTNVADVWKLDDTVDDDIETIDPDNLLDDDDFKKPDPSLLRVCGTTGVRKACKNCSCGLAEELEAENKEKQAPTVRSSCGNCYLGDAFRCASCPYLGMPAFKPGEKIQLTNTQLAVDN